MAVTLFIGRDDLQSVGVAELCRAITSLNIDDVVSDVFAKLWVEGRGRPNLQRPDDDQPEFQIQNM